MFVISLSRLDDKVGGELFFAGFCLCPNDADASHIFLNALCANVLGQIVIG